MRWLPLCCETIINHPSFGCYCLAKILRSASLCFEVTPRDHDFAELSNIVSEIVPRSFIYLSDLKSGLTKVCPPIPLVLHCFRMFLSAEEPPTFPCPGNFSTSISEAGRHLFTKPGSGAPRDRTVRSGSSSRSPCRPRCISRFGTESPTAAGLEGKGGPLRLVETSYFILKLFGDVSHRFS